MQLDYNPKQKFIKSIDWLINFIILLTIGLVPLYFAFSYKDYSVFALDKVVLFRTLTEIILLLYVVKVLLAKKIVITYNKWQIILPALFFLSYTLATIFSYSPYTSFWGHYFRHQGLFTYLHYFLFFLLVGLNYDFTKEKKQKRFFITILISSFLVCLYGIIQYLGLDWYQWQEPLLKRRIHSTLGQPNFLGAYLVLIIPLSVFFLIKFKNYFFRLIIGIILLFQLLVLLLTYSRSAWLGMIFICFLGFCYFLYFKQYKKILIVIIGLTTILSITLSGILLTGGIDFDINKRHSITNRLTSYLVLDMGSNKARLDTYKVAFEAINMQPTIGYGPETMWLWFPQFYHKDLLIYEKLNTYYDRIHNEILDIIIFTGFIGIISYLILLTYSLFKIFRILLKKNNYYINRSNFLFIFFLSLALIGYFVVLQFGFSITTTSIYFWLYLAAIFLLINKNTGYKSRVIIFSFRPVAKYLSIFLFFVCITYIMWQFNISRIIADIYFYRAMSGVVAHENFNEVNNKFLKSLQYNPQEDYYRARYADKLINTAKTIEPCKEKNQLLIPAISFLEEIPKDRRDIKMQLNLVKAKAFYNHCLGYKDFNKIDKKYQEVINFSPELASLRVDGGEMYYYIEEYEKAIENFRDALKLYPDLTDKRINQEHREQIKKEMVVVHKLLADAYSKIKNQDKALVNYLQANKLLGSGVNFDLRNKIVEIYLKNAEYEKAIDFDKHSLILSNNDYFYILRLMNNYKLAEDLENAKKYAEEVIKIDKENELAKEILSQ